MTRKTDAARPARKTIARRAKAKAATPAVVPSTLRRDLGQQASRFALLTAIGLAAAGGGSLAAPGEALADCLLSGGGNVITCGATTTTNVSFPAGYPTQRHTANITTLTVSHGATVSGYGLAGSNPNPVGPGLAVTNNGVVRVDANLAPTAGGEAALNLSASGGPLTYSGAGDIINEGTGEGLRADQTGAGLVDLNVGGNVRSVGDSAIHATMGAAGTGMTIVTNGAVEAGGLAGIWAESTAADGDISVTANGAVRGDTVGILANQGGTSAGDVSVTSNGPVEGGVVGIEATTFGSGAVTVRANGPVRSDVGAGIRTFAAGGAVDIASGEVTSGGTGISVTGFGGASPETVRVNATGSITSANGSGIDATSAGTMDTVVTGNISAGQDGLNLGAGFADSGGTGDLVASVDGSVTAGAYGARLHNEGDGAIDVTIAGVVNAGETGVSASAEGGINLTLGSVTGGTAGIRTRGREATSGDISVTVAGDVVALAGRGFESIQDGIGATDFVTGGDVTGTGGSAVHVNHTAADGGRINIDIGGDVTATGTDADGAPADGVDATTNGLNSDITIRTRGAVQADGYGVIASISAGPTSDGDISITTDGDVSAAVGGLSATNNGTGRVDIVANGDVTGETGTGISATGSTVAIRAAGDVSGGFHGIRASLTPASTGSIDIDVDGDVTGAVQGVGVSNSGAGGTRIDVEGSITAGNSGVNVSSQPLGGDVSIRVGGSIQANNGVNVFSNANQSDISITTEGDVTATTNGIRVERIGGEGDTTVQAAGDISGAVGVSIDQAGGAGDVSITSSGTTTGATGAGIRVANNVGSISIDAANITGATNGIEFDNIDADTISITGSGDIIAQNGNAIRIDEVGPGGVSIERTGLIQSDGDDAILITDLTPNGGDISVSVENVTARGAGADGIVVTSMSDEASIAIETSGDVRADGYGVTGRMDNGNATGDIFLRLGGAVEGALGGIDIFSNSAGAVDIASTGSISSQQTAVAVNANGVVRVDLEGPVTGARGLDIRRDANGGGANVVRTGAVTATDGRGIAFLNNGDQTTLVEARGHVSATNGDGINVLNNANGGDVTVIADSVTATGEDDVESRAADGINVVSQAGGASISVTANGDVRTSEDGTGITVRHNALNASGNVSITARGDVSGGVGISAITNTTGAMTIVADGNVTGADAQGIIAETNGALDVVINGHVTGYSTGISLAGGEETGEDVTLTGTGGVTSEAGNAIEVRNDGDGGVTIDLSGDVVATGGSGYVVRALEVDNEDISVTTGNVTAEDGFGVDVRALATSTNIDITTNGDILAGSQGVYAAIAGTGQGNIAIEANGATQGYIGIHADNDGTGNVRIVSNGAVRGVDQEGIWAEGRRAVDVEVNDTVTGATRGMVVIGGEAGIDPAINADITVTGAGGVISGDGDALNIENLGSGDVRVALSGDISATGGHGVIVVADTGDAGSIDITTGNVSADGAGIVAASEAIEGDVTVRANGDVSGDGGGIVASLSRSSATGDVNVTTEGSVSGTFGIAALNSGHGVDAGDINIVVNGDVTGTTGEGLAAFGERNVDVEINGTVTGATRGAVIAGGEADEAGDITVRGAGGIVSGNGHALAVTSRGMGDILVDLAGDISATNGAGLMVADTAGGGDISITTGAIRATGDGIIVDANTTAGDLTITVNQGVEADEQGIFARLGDAASTGSISVTARGDVSGENGIFAGSVGLGAISVTADGDVSASDEYGIRASGRDAVTLVANGIVSGVNEGARVIGGRAGVTADVSVSGTGGFVASDGSALQVLNNGAGNTTIDISGASSATGGSGIVVRDTAEGGDVTVTVGAVSAVATALAPVAYGVDLREATLVGDVTFTGLDDIYGTTAGIIAGLTGAAATGAVSITTQGAVAGGDGITAFNNGFGALSVTADGDVTGETGHGIEAVGRGAVSLAINGQVTGAGLGMLIQGGELGTGDIVVTGTGGVSSGTEHAVIISNLGSGGIQYDLSGPLSSATGDGLMIRDLEIGGDIDVVTGDIAALAGNGLNIVSSSRTANLDVTVDGDVEAGDFGVIAQLAHNQGTGNPNLAEGDVNVAVNGDISAASGILAVGGGQGGAVNVAVNGDVTAVDGSGVQIGGTGDATLFAEGSIAGSSSGAVIGAAGDILVSGDGDISGEEAHGLLIEGQGDGNILVNLTGDISGATTGLTASVGATGADILIDVADVTATSATGRGIDAFSSSTAGDIVVSAGAVNGGQTGIRALRDEAVIGATGSISIETAGPVQADTGILARNVGAGSTRVVATGAVQATNGSGIVAIAQGGAVSIEAGSVTAAGADSMGVLAQRTGAGVGIVSVDVNSARGARGVFASNSGDGDVIVTAETATGTAEEGVLAQKLGVGAGDVSVTVGSATGRRGILANNQGAGATRVTSTGTITAAETDGVLAFAAGAGGIFVDVNNVGGGTVGVHTSNNGTGATEIDISGTVTGSAAGVLAASSADQDVRIRNDGTIRNASNRSSDIALQAGGGAIELTNAGTILGRLVMQGDTSNTVNSGHWNSIDGVSLFQGDDDQLFNTATGVITGGANAAASETTVWMGLEGFTNGGVIDMADGGAGDLIATSADTVLTAGSSFQVDIAGQSLADAFRTTGALTIEAGTELDVTFIQPLVLGARYVVAEALLGLTGEFIFQDRLISAFLGLRDGYTDTEAYLELWQMRAFADAGDTWNRRETGRGVDSLDEDNPLHEAILLLPDDGAARAAFDQLSGEIHPAMRRAMVDESRLSREAVLGRLESDGEGRVWAHGLYGRGRVGADGNATRADRDTGGVIFGADGSIAPGVTIGAAGGWIDTDIDLQRRNSDGTARNVHAIGYAGFRMDRWSLRGGVGYSWTSVDTDRSVAFPGVTDRLRAEYDGSVMQAFLEAGYRVPTNGGYVEPFVNLTTIHANTDAFREIGGVARIEGEGVRDDLNMATAGFRVQTARPGAFSARGMFGVRHMDGDLAQAGQHRFPGGAVFTILTSPHDDIAAVATFEADWQLTPWLSLGAVFDGAKGEDGGDHAITGRLKMAF